MGEIKYENLACMGEYVGEAWEKKVRVGLYVVP